MMSNQTRRLFQPTMADLAKAIEDGHVASNIDAGMYVITHRALRHWISRDQQLRAIYPPHRRHARQRPAS